MTTWRHSCIWRSRRSRDTGAAGPTNKYFVGDKFFAGGIQVNGDGNANMIGVKGKDGHRFSFRGPGSVASPTS